MSDDIRIAPCREPDVPALMRFIHERWQAAHVLSRDEALLRWQYDPSLIGECHFEGPTVLLAWHAEELVGMLGLTGFDFNSEGTITRGVWLSHWLTVPEYRRFGVAFRLLAAMRGMGFDAFGTLGTDPTLPSMLRTVGLELIPDLPRWVGVVDRDRTAELLVNCSPAPARSAVLELCERHLVHDSDAMGPGETGLEVVGWSQEVASAWDRYWSTELAGALVGTKRDARYLRWRYLEHPRFKYEIYAARRSPRGPVTGMVVFRLEQVRARAERVLRVVELLASPEAAVELARTVVRAARAEGVAFADFYCSSSRAASGLVSVGFRPEPRGVGELSFPTRLQPLETGRFKMTVVLWLPKGWRGRLDRLVESQRLYITKADGDQDRPN